MDSVIKGFDSPLLILSVGFCRGMNWRAGLVSVNIFQSLSLLGRGVVFVSMVFVKLVNCSSRKGGEILNMGITRLAHHSYISISWQH